MCTLLYTTVTHFAVSQSVLQNRFTELRPSVDQSKGFKLSLNDEMTDGMTESPNVVIAQPKGSAIIKSMNSICIIKGDSSMLHNFTYFSKDGTCMQHF